MTSEGQHAGQPAEATSGDGFLPDTDGRRTPGRASVPADGFPHSYGPPPQATPNGGSPFVVPAVPPSGQAPGGAPADRYGAPPAPPSAGPSMGSARVPQGTARVPQPSDDSSGFPGPSGFSGPPGFPGPSGFAGSDGFAGPDGFAGSPGFPDTAASSGEDVPPSVWAPPPSGSSSAEDNPFDSHPYRGGGVSGGPLNERNDFDGFAPGSPTRGRLDPDSSASGPVWGAAVDPAPYDPAPFDPAPFDPPAESRPSASFPSGPDSRSTGSDARGSEYPSSGPEPDGSEASDERPPGVSAFGDQRVRVPGATLASLSGRTPPGHGEPPSRFDPPTSSDDHTRFGAAAPSDDHTRFSAPTSSDDQSRLGASDDSRFGPPAQADGSSRFGGPALDFPPRPAAGGAEIVDRSADGSALPRRVASDDPTGFGGQSRSGGSAALPRRADGDASGRRLTTDLPIRTNRPGTGDESPFGGRSTGGGDSMFGFTPSSGRPPGTDPAESAQPSGAAAATGLPAFGEAPFGDQPGRGDQPLFGQQPGWGAPPERGGEQPAPALGGSPAARQDPFGGTPGTSFGTAPAGDPAAARQDPPGGEPSSFGGSPVARQDPFGRAEPPSAARPEPHTSGSPAAQEDPFGRAEPFGGSPTARHEPQTSGSSAFGGSPAAAQQDPFGRTEPFGGSPAAAQQDPFGRTEPFGGSPAAAQPAYGLDGPGQAGPEQSGLGQNGPGLEVRRSTAYGSPVVPTDEPGDDPRRSAFGTPIPGSDRSPYGSPVTATDRTGTAGTGQSPYAPSNDGGSSDPYAPGGDIAGQPLYGRSNDGPGDSPYSRGGSGNDELYGRPQPDGFAPGSPYGRRVTSEGDEPDTPDTQGNGGFPQRTPGTSLSAAIADSPGSVPAPRDPADTGGSAKGTARPVSASASVPMASRVGPVEADEIPPPAKAPQARVYGRPTQPVEDDSPPSAPVSPLAQPGGERYGDDLGGNSQDLPPLGPKTPPPGGHPARATASARVVPPQAPGPEGPGYAPPGRTTPPDNYNENTTDMVGRRQPADQPYVPAPALPSLHARPPLVDGFPPAPGAEESTQRQSGLSTERPRLGGVFPGPGGAGPAEPGSQSRATVTPPGPDETSSWPGPSGAGAGPEQSRFEQFKPDTETPAKPETPHVRRLPVLLAVIIGAVLVVGIPMGIVWLIARGSDSGFSATAGDCVKQSGTQAVKANCGDPGTFTVVSTVDAKEQCPDPGQPYVLNPSDGKTQVLCLKPNS